MFVRVVQVAAGKPYTEACPALPRPNAGCPAKSSDGRDWDPWIDNACS